MATAPAGPLAFPGVVPVHEEPFHNGTLFVPVLAAFGKLAAEAAAALALFAAFVA